MTAAEWEAIAARLETAWPPFPLDRRALYFEVLSDVDMHGVASAVDELLREGWEQLPAPGVIRQRALQRAGAGPAPSSSPVPPPGPSSPSAAFLPPVPPPPPGVPLSPAMAGGTTAFGESATRPDDGTPGTAVASLVLGIVGLLVVPIVCSILAIIFGVIALGEIKKNPRRGGRTMALWGLWLGIVATALWVLLLFALVGASDDASSYSVAWSLLGTRIG